MNTGLSSERLFSVALKVKVGYFSRWLLSGSLDYIEPPHDQSSRTKKSKKWKPATERAGREWRVNSGAYGLSQYCCANPRKNKSTPRNAHHLFPTALVTDLLRVLFSLASTCIFFFNSHRVIYVVPGPTPAVPWSSKLLGTGFKMATLAVGARRKPGFKWKGWALGFSSTVEPVAWLPLAQLPLQESRHGFYLQSASQTWSLEVLWQQSLLLCVFTQPWTFSPLYIPPRIHWELITHIHILKGGFKAGCFCVTVLAVLELRKPIGKIYLRGRRQCFSFCSIGLVWCLNIWKVNSTMREETWGEESVFLLSCCVILALNDHTWQLKSQAV